MVVQWVDRLRRRSSESPLQPSHTLCMSPKSKEVSCAACSRPILPNWPCILRKGTRTYFHKSCLRCCICSMLETEQPGSNLMFQGDSILCENHLHKFGWRCDECGEPIGQQLDAIHHGKSKTCLFHKACHVCSVCFDPSIQYDKRLGLLRCGQHKRTTVPAFPCNRCGVSIHSQSNLRWFEGSYYHRKCFTCLDCGTPLRRNSSSWSRDRPIKLDAKGDCRCLTCALKVSEAIPTFPCMEGSYSYTSIELGEFYDMEESRSDAGFLMSGEIRISERGNELGRGSYGTVYRCKTTQGSEVAMKEIPLGQSEDTVSLLQEVRILRLVQHPNIVQFYGVELSDSFLRIFMEFIDGCSLDSGIQTHGVFSEPRLRNAATQILHGLAFLHSKGLIHRDLKTSNILWSNDGKFKLADFGSAKKLKNQQSLQASAKYVGTPLYQPPEYVKTQLYTWRSDIWSFGCIMLEMLTGKLPWSEKKFENIFQAWFYIIDHEEKGHTPAIPDFLSPQCRSFLHRCLQRNPNQRWSAADLLQHSFLRRRASSTASDRYGQSQ